MWNPHEKLPDTTSRALGIGGLVAVVVIWTALSASGAVSIAKLPPPWTVVQALVDLSWHAEKQTSPLLLHMGWSAYRVGLAMLLVCVTGIPLGVIMGSSPRVDAVLSPVIDPLRSAPIVAVLPILMMWLGIDERMKIAFLWLGAVVYLVPMVRDAIRAVPQEYVTLSYDIGATPIETVWHTIFPLARPRIFDAIIVAVGIEWTYITVAEYVNASEGLGYLIQTARKYSAMDQVFAGILVILVLALATDKALRLLKGWMFPWETET